MINFKSGKGGKFALMFLLFRLTSSGLDVEILRAAQKDDGMVILTTLGGRISGTKLHNQSLNTVL
jgi:hypothetical protein